MKTKRVKNYRRTIDLYDTHFGLKTNPLEILVDSTFARQALIQQLHIEQQFKCTLSCEFILVTSSCIILECEKLGQLFSGALQIIQQYKVLKCTHKVHKDTSAFSCIKRRILTARSKKCSETKSRKGSLLFALASNDELLQQYARTVPGMPIFFIAHKRINLESIPTPVSLLLQQKATRAPDLTLSECSKIKQFCDRFGFSEESFTRRKKTKGPNPLSCKQKLHKPYILKRTTTKRKRKRIKMTWAMKQVVERLKTEQSSKDA
ncbi:unnamed protein product [Schistosoma mattheei]|uniref:U3 small nucleolar RNA-associated protein 23 n=1 Tax=Schistosoma mattheei TaxID=31246 RepID=A0A183P8P5_9TREM|nr:unnamed protein product [Schistosoma mattheei]VDP55737.1 unnamed protein product [Schistosoma mattheei]